ncbi:unnamed protein product [Urochloa decumbens]|uniref:LysM domain-containing protein n=1 Tax=Urochloa decumbens TaxID=240449 RepID=A0ABC8Z214_9POAL
MASRGTTALVFERTDTDCVVSINREESYKHLSQRNRYRSVTLADAAPPASPLICKIAYGIKERETCFAVAQTTGLPLKKFLRFNPNINCNNLFIGQWVCLFAVHAA